METPTPGSDEATLPTSNSDLSTDGPSAELTDEFQHQVQQFGQELVEQLPDHVAPQFIRLFPISFARSHAVLAFEAADGLTLAIGSLRGLKVLDIVRRLCRCPVAPLFVRLETLQPAINTAYEVHGATAQDVLQTLDVAPEIRISHDGQDLLDSTRQSPVIRLVNQILFEAIKSRASDIHIQPADGRVLARFRIDGVLFDAIDIPKSLQDEVVSRIKVLGNMDIAEKRLPQDGRATVRIAERVIDLRIASMPTSHQERIVIRLLDKSARLYTLTELGMADRTLSQFRKVIFLEHGLLLVTGPTGSGKSTTLYAALKEISTRERNILTLEDPIEYELDGVSQTQINEKKGLTFAGGLRSVLRQDPDIIMVGEVRDHETAVMAIQSSLTGHLVYSTLHTNDAASAVTRLLDLGIEPYLVASSLLAVLAQRLVRRICKSCRQTCTLDPAQVAWLESGKGLLPLRFYLGAGCEECRHTGFHGRLGIFELMTVNEKCRSLIQLRANASELRSAAIESGMVLLAEDGLSKVESGETSLAEIIRVAQPAAEVE